MEQLGDGPPDKGRGGLERRIEQRINGVNRIYSANRDSAACHGRRPHRDHLQQRDGQ